ncbi:hypothetical protein PF006_g18797 [Phytophthora fragariae]|uniref:Uncharacterized protein n=1 Tax=Phytophthora fragariae TaxID=53985 RepID=A0A6A3SJK2_9STRA|nr:hypothetical protein PF006_g18797 [Phytophthora fragariae]
MSRVFFVARQIRKTDFERLQKFYNFFVANDEATVRATNAKGEQLTALTKNGEKELAWRDSLGEMDSIIGAHFGTTSLCYLLREILSHDGHARLVLVFTDKDLQTAFGAMTADADGWAKTNQNLQRRGEPGAARSQVLSIRPPLRAPTELATPAAVPFRGWVLGRTKLDHRPR